jgi:hypothetical protein
VVPLVGFAYLGFYGYCPKILKQGMVALKPKEEDINLILQTNHSNIKEINSKKTVKSTLMVFFE